MGHGLKVVLWKNLVIRKRHYFLTICEALVPILLFLLIAYGRSKISGLNKTEVLEVTNNGKYLIDPVICSINSEALLLYTPNTKYYEDIVHIAQEELQLINNNVRGFSSMSKLMEAYVKNGGESPIIAVTFGTNGTNKFEYTIRTHEPYTSWKTDQLFSTRYVFQPGQGSIYLWKGLLTLQKALDLAFIHKSSHGIKLNLKLWTQEFPYPPYKIDSAIQTLFIDFMPLITLFSFIFVCPAVLKRVVEEKYSGIKELMKMVGMKAWMLWLGWFIYSMLPILFSVIFIVIFMKVDIFGADYPAIEFTDGTVLFVFLILYCATVTIFCFFISTFFSKLHTITTTCDRIDLRQIWIILQHIGFMMWLLPIFAQATTATLATLTGVLIWILSYFVPKYLLGNGNATPYYTSVLLLFLPNMALHYGYSVISVFEEREIGVQWNTIYTTPSNSANDVTMCTIITMLVTDSVLYLCLTLYLDKVNPGKYGIRESYFFVFSSLKTYFNKLLGRDSVSHYDVESMHLEHVENGQGLKEGIKLHRLTKRYGKKVAVNNLSMEIYQDQITVLLGHNGAGKSTTMGMITGLISKTTGTIMMGGKTINCRSEVTDSIGLCPQHNLLFPDLTVYEHLKFFAMLKGRTSLEADQEINDLLEKLSLSEKAYCLAHTLSGGMKRKLCLGMAVVGGSKILVLDEPSSGMDPESRRHLWDLLLAWRNKKTILITTHFMEEADTLGDWIAIMSDGYLRCFGTPMFLKKKYETGYHLSLMLKNTLNSCNQSGNRMLDDEGSTKIHSIETEIGKFFDGVKCKSVNGSEVLFVLPFESSYSELFEHLEERKNELYIEKISLTTTTLEDVFLNSKDTVHGKEADVTDSEDSDSLKGETKYLLTVKALFQKRYNFMKKKYLTYLLPFIIALVFLALCIYLGSGANNTTESDGPPIKIDLSKYGKTKAFIQVTDTAEAEKLRLMYENSVIQQGSQAVEINEPSNISAAILQEAYENIAFYHQHMIVSGEIAYADKSLIEATALYNNLALHSAPISVNLLTNSLAKMVLGEEYSISITNWPLEKLTQQATNEELSGIQIGLLWLIIFPIGALFFLGSFLFFPHIELSTNFTQLQFMCGVSPFLYWLVNLLCDFLIYLVFALAMASFNLIWAPFRGWNEMGTLFSILVMYGFCGIPYTYLFSRKKSSSGGYALHIILGLLMGVVCTVVTIALLESGNEFYVDKGTLLRAVFLMLCPQFGITYYGVEFAKKAVQNYNLHSIAASKLNDFCREKPNPCCSGSQLDMSSAECVEYRSYLGTLGIHFVWMFMGGILYFTINVLLHNYTLKKLVNTVSRHSYDIWNQITKKQTDNEQGNNLMIHGTHFDGEKTNTLNVRKLRKSYSGREVVKDIDFCLNNGECLGILGVNGAGKTTTFRMLTREEIKDDGTITANGQTIDKDEYLKKLGYCPQIDALNYALTGREILNLMAMLRGIDDPELPTVVNNFLRLFELESLADIPCEYYSGGNKRKLSFAVAIIGFPDFVLLDEPTNGVDPSTRRKFWSLINNFKNSHKTSFILTSHSMTECEALCNDLKILKEGTIKKQGTISKLKGELGGFSIKLKLKHQYSKTSGQERGDLDEMDGPAWNSATTCCDTVDELRKYLDQTYGGEVKDEHPGLLHYYIKNTNKKLSALFREIETLKMANLHLVEDYSISEASLEDVFLTVARS